MIKEVFDFPVCFNCKHRLGVRQCEAFLDEIPDEIWLGGHEHKEPLKAQDNTIIFEPINKEE
jgi:hypothetical protein